MTGLLIWCDAKQDFYEAFPSCELTGFDSSGSEWQMDGFEYPLRSTTTSEFDCNKVIR